MQTCVKNVFPVVTYGRLITKEILNMLAPKVFTDAYKKVVNIVILLGNFWHFGKLVLRRGGRL